MDEVKDELLAQARKRMDAATQGDQENREEALDDLRFLAGIGQWPDDIQQDRAAAGKPCLIVNQLPQFLRQVTGDIRSTNPSIKVTAADSAADPKIAETFEGIIRQIQNRSGASSVYERGAESAAACGMGYWRILADYEHEGSFNQDIRIESIPNPFSVYFDPDAMLSTREDAEYCFITQSMNEEAFREEYPDANAEPINADGITDNLHSWRDGDKVIIAEYFWKERKAVKMYLLPDGSTVIAPETKPTAFLKERDGTQTVIKWAKISGKDVLEGPQDTPWKHIPVVAVMGEELYAGDRMYRSSVIRHAKGPQSIFNITWSTAIEVAAMQPKSPWLVTPTQIAGFEAMWAEPDANKTTLLYNPDPTSGAPQRIAPPMSSQALSELLTRAAMELRSTTGIQDAALGARSAEKSGVAIRQRQQESDNSTSIYADNMGKAIAHTGRIIVAAAPNVYDTARTLQTIAKDGTAGMAEVNQISFTPEGQPQQIDLSRGQYDVEVEVGPNYATRMQAAADGMMQFMQINPQAAMLIGDLMATAMDWPGADQIAERLKAALPPGIAQDKDAQPDPAQMQAMQMQQQEQMRMAEMGKIMQELEIRQKVAEASKAEAQATEAQAKAMQAQVEARVAGMMPAPMQA